MTGQRGKITLAEQRNGRFSGKPGDRSFYFVYEGRKSWDGVIRYQDFGHVLNTFRREYVICVTYKC